MLIFDSEQFCIPAEESEVEAVYRSSDPVFIGAEESLPSCEAFVCVIDRDRRHVFAALHIREIKRNLIYVAEPSAEDPSSPDPEKILAFVEAMGFTMESVNLKYGKAMREVVLRSIPVLLSPENLERTRIQKEAELSELNRLISEAAEEPEDAAEESDPEKQEEKKRAREARKSTAKNAALKVALEKSAAEKASSIGEMVQKFLLQANISELAHTGRAELERLRRENAMVEKRAAELAGTVGRLKEQAEKDRAEARRRIAELEAEVDKNRKEAEAARAGQEKAASEKEAGEKRNADQEKALREVREELEAEKDRGRELAGTRKGLEKQILELKKNLSVEASKKKAKSPAEAALTQAEERIARLEQEVAEALETAEAERFERELLMREKAAALRRIEELETEGVGIAGMRENSERDHRLEMEKRLAPPPPHVIRRPPPKDAFFHVDWDLGSVEYESPEDILEVHQSMNMAQLSLEGYHGQHCLAWIVGMKKGKSRQVHVVFGLSESDRNLIYSPVKPVRNTDDYKRALTEAVKFLEVVGYLPEKVSLKKSPREQDAALKNIPVLQGPRKQAQGF